MITGSHYIRITVEPFSTNPISKQYHKNYSMLCFWYHWGVKQAIVDEGLFVTHEFAGDMVVHVGSHVA